MTEIRQNDNYSSLINFNKVVVWKLHDVISIGHLSKFDVQRYLLTTLKSLLPSLLTHNEEDTNSYQSSKIH